MKYMASVQERMQINPVSVDKWSTREQLCLASAVLCNGDQNWTNVSRSLKQVCGANRPADWFSHISCAVQYEELLENANSAKKNKQSTGEVTDVSAAAVGNASLDLILRHLKEERVQELKAEIRREQEEYAKVYAELKTMQSGQLSEDEVTEMWKEIEKEQEMNRIEEMKLENQLREREQNKHDIQRNWRANVGTTLTSGYGNQKTEDNLQDIIGANKPPLTGSQLQPATSPLLTSLLKSPTPGSAAAAVLANTAHVTSPTITTLLTGGAIIQNQPAITLKNNIPANEAAQLLTRPISGPPMEPPLSGVSSGTQNLLSPSQSAPTLSMLLEKRKVTTPNSLKAAAIHTNSSVPVEPVNEKKDASLASDSNNEEVPMDIEEDVVASSTRSADMLEADDSDTDANEEQQLLEVFKNIGTIDELEDIDVAAVIDEEVDFLKSVGDEAVDETEEVGFEDQPVQQSKNLIEEHIPQVKPQKSIKNIEEQSETSAQKSDTKVETISSDDSNDNIPLATLGGNSSHDTKEVGKVLGHKEKFHNQLNESLSKGKDGNILTQPEDYDDSSQSDNCKELKNLSSQKSPTSESSEVIIIPTDDESSGDKQHAEPADKNKQLGEDDAKVVEDGFANEPDEHKDMNATLNLDSLEEASNSTALKRKDFGLDTHEAPTTISLADTDEYSSETTDISTKIDEKMLTLEKLSAQIKKGCEESKAEETKLFYENSAVNQTTSKSQAIRKLRDRDRSESPMPNLDDDTTTASDHSATQRLRRRYSSTPLIDSIPNSPASSDRDDRDLKISKKYLLNLYNALMVSKNAAAFQHAHNEHATKFKHICNRCTDFQLIKRNIETGTIRSVHELQRNILLLCQNAIMVFETNSLDYRNVCSFMKDCQNTKEFISDGNKLAALKLPEKDNKETRTSTSSSHSSGVKVRGSSRKSLRTT